VQVCALGKLGQKSAQSQRTGLRGGLKGVGGANFQMRIPVQFDKLNRRAKERGGFFCLGHALRRRAMSPGFAARANDKMRRATSAGFFRDDAAAPELDVVGMRAEDQ